MLPLIIVLHVKGANFCIPFCAAIAIPVLWVFSEPIAKKQVAKMFRAVSAKNVKIDARCSVPQHSMLIPGAFTNGQHITQCG